MMWYGARTPPVSWCCEMPEAEQNVVWNLFSGDARLHSWSSLLNELLEFYGLEGIAMPYTMEDFEREAAEKLLKKLTPEQRLKGLSPEQRLEGMSPEQLEELERYLQTRKAAKSKDAGSPQNGGEQP